MSLDIIIPKGARLETPAKQISLSPGEFWLRCRCGHMEFRTVLQVDREQTTARVKALVCLQCGTSHQTVDGVLQVHGEVTTHGS